MKLRNKLFTALSLTTIGVSTPIAISSCSCSNTYQINYGDAINCKNKEDKNVKYHSVNDVKNAAKDHIQNPQPEIEIIVWDANNVQQDFYWDLVYSTAMVNKEFTLTWNFVDGSLKKKVSGGKYNDIAFTSLKYVKNASNKYVIATENDTELIQSYMYSEKSE